LANSIGITSEKLILTGNVIVAELVFKTVISPVAVLFDINWTTVISPEDTVTDVTSYVSLVNILTS